MPSRPVRTIAEEQPAGDRGRASRRRVQMLLQKLKQYGVGAVASTAPLGPQAKGPTQLWKSAAVGHWCVVAITKLTDARKPWTNGLASGARVVIQGLKARPELNGRHATVVGLKTEAERLFVYADDSTSDEMLSLKADNLLALGGGGGGDSCGGGGEAPSP